MRHTAHLPAPPDRPEPLLVTDAPPPIPVTHRSAWPQFVLRLVSLVVFIAAAWQLVNRGMGLWAEHADAVVGQVAPYVPQPDPDALSPLLALGEPDAPMQVVLACDVALPACRHKLALLTKWQSEKSVALGHLDDDATTLRRLVFLTRPTNDATMRGALAWLALHAQGLAWPHVAQLAEDTRTWDGTWDGHFTGVSPDAARFDALVDDPETMLTALTQRTMAEALDVPPVSGVLANGLPVAATAAEGEALLQALHQAEMALAAAIDALDGDVAPAQARLLAALPARQQERYVQWILVGEKVHLFADASPSADDAPADDGGAGDDDEDDEDEEEGP